MIMTTRMRRRIGRGLCLALMIALTVTGATLAAELNAGADCDTAGGIATVPVTFVNDSLVTAVQFDVTYDPAEVLPGTPTGGLALADHVVSGVEVSPGLFRVVLYSPTNTLLGDGELVSIPFTISGSATMTPIPFELPLNGGGAPPYAGPGAVLANVGSVKSLPTPDPTAGGIELIQVTGPVGQSSCIGGPVAMFCSSTGPGPTSYQWIKDGFGPIPGATMSSYAIGVTEQSDIGNYRCEVNDAVCGVVASDPALLFVEDFPCAPIPFRVYDPGTGGELLTEWNPNPSTSVDRYRLYWGETSGGPYPSSIDLAVSEGLTVDSLPNGTRQFFRVSAFVANNEGPLSEEGDAVPTGGGLILPQAPDYGYNTPVSGDIAHPDVVTYRFPPRQGDVTIWYDLFDVDFLGEVAVLLNGVEVDLLDGSSSNWTGSTTLTLPGMLVKNDAENVLTFDNTVFDDLPTSEELWAVRDVSIRLPAPIVQAQAWSQTVDLAINQLSNEPTLDFFDIHRGTFSGFVPISGNLHVSGFTGTGYRDEIGVTNGQPYYYVLRPIDTIGNRGFDSAEESAVPSDVEVTPVVDLRIGKSGVDDLSLVWSNVVTEQGVLNYKIFEGIAPDVVIDSGSTTVAPAFTSTGDQSDGLSHFYLIIAVDGLGRESSP